MSDINLTVLVSFKHELDSARRSYFEQRPPIDWPVDILFMTEEEFSKRGAVGGLCYIATSEGRTIYQRGVKE